MDFNYAKRLAQTQEFVLIWNIHIFLPIILSASRCRFFFENVLILNNYWMRFL